MLKTRVNEEEMAGVQGSKDSITGRVHLRESQEIYHYRGRVERKKDKKKCITFTSTKRLKKSRPNVAVMGLMRATTVTQKEEGKKGGAIRGWGWR